MLARVSHEEIMFSMVKRSRQCRNGFQKKAKKAIFALFNLLATLIPLGIIAADKGGTYLFIKRLDLKYS